MQIQEARFSTIKRKTIFHFPLQYDPSKRHYAPAHIILHDEPRTMAYRDEEDKSIHTNHE